MPFGQPVLTTQPNGTTKLSNNKTRKLERERERQAGRERDRQTDRQTDRQKQRQRTKKTVWVLPCISVSVPHPELVHFYCCC